MPHSLPLITTLATALGLALIMGFVAIKLKLPTLVGYLMAGVILGPFTPGFVANTQIAAELAEIGVMLLMFGVGLHFSLNNLYETRRIALPGALLQIVVATCLGALIALTWGWSFGSAFVFGLALSVASTVVMIRALESHGLLNTINGQIAVGWLIVEDIVMILGLVFLPFMAEWFGEGSTEKTQNLWLLLGITLFKISSFIAFMLLVGRWMLPKFLWHITRTASRELFTLCVIVVAVSIAFGASKLFGVSFALGAFFAGMIIGESKFSQRAAEESLPFREAFAVLFFVSVGMLFDPFIFIEKPLHVLAVVGIIIIGKSIAAAALVLAFRYPLNTALTVSASLAQIGEFSFILASQGVFLKILPSDAQGLILAGSLISISLNPFLFKLIGPLQIWMQTKFSWVQTFMRREEDPLIELPTSTDEKYLSEHVVLVGYGRVGERIGSTLLEEGIPYIVVEQNRELVEKLRANQIPAVFGNAAEPLVLVQAYVAQAGMLVVATPHILSIRETLNIARKLNSKIELAICVENEEEKALLTQEIADVFFLSEEELAKSISAYILIRLGKSL
jgi:CPA2 family monovalent cation:H+ antiporter-2